MLPYVRNLINWFSIEIIEIVATRCHILRLKCTNSTIEVTIEVE